MAYAITHYPLPLIVVAVLLTQRKPTPPEDAQLQNSLLRKARGDRDLVDRLITYEQRLNPHGTRRQWLTAAHDRWDRDRR